MLGLEAPEGLFQVFEKILVGLVSLGFFRFEGVDHRIQAAQDFFFFGIILGPQRLGPFKEHMLKKVSRAGRAHVFIHSAHPEADAIP